MLRRLVAIVVVLCVHPLALDASSVKVSVGTKVRADTESKRITASLTSSSTKRRTSRFRS